MPLYSDKIFTGNKALPSIVEEHPYCSLAQFYLLADLKKYNNADAEKQLSKTALFFKDPNWLRWQLHILLNSDTENDQITENINPQSPVIKQAKIAPVQTVENTESEIALEPLYTVDYFASQGIKIKEEQLQSDKLGKQMKSFTEWLKTMKKIDKSIPSGDENDIKVQNLAENSNTQAEVITEAMAEVLVKQNKTSAAIDMYQKLSLINPRESGYFAAKINSLLGQIKQ